MIVPSGYKEGPNPQVEGWGRTGLEYARPCSGGQNPGTVLGATPAFLSQGLFCCCQPWARLGSSRAHPAPSFLGPVCLSVPRNTEGAQVLRAEAVCEQLTFRAWKPSSSQLQGPRGVISR